MAIILIEEVLMGLADVKVSLEQAISTLDALVEDLSPILGEELRDEMENALRQCLHSFNGTSEAGGRWFSGRLKGRIKWQPLGCGVWPGSRYRHLPGIQPLE